MSGTIICFMFHCYINQSFPWELIQVRRIKSQLFLCWKPDFELPSFIFQIQLNLKFYHGKLQSKLNNELSFFARFYHNEKRKKLSWKSIYFLSYFSYVEHSVDRMQTSFEGVLLRMTKKVISKTKILLWLMALSIIHARHQ